MKLLMENWRRYLDEAAATNVEDYAMLVKPVAGGQVIVLYNVKSALAEIEEEQSIGQYESIKGYIHVGPSMHSNKDAPCYSPRAPAKAWEVQQSVAIDKTGPMLYDIGLSITRLKGAVGLMPDRKDLSSEAEGLWKQYYERGQGATGIKVVKKELDAPPPENKTEPTDDDCPVWKDRHPSVNHIYSAASRAPYLVDLQMRHKRFMKAVQKTVNYTDDEIETLIWEAGESLWDEQYQFEEGKKKKKQYYEPALQDDYIVNEKDYQKMQQKRHPPMKKKLIGLGGNKTKSYSGKPSFKRSKSAPPGE